MSPTIEESWRSGIIPMAQNKEPVEVALPKILNPFRKFMLKNTREKDVEIILKEVKNRLSEGSELEAEDLRVIVPSFLISELRRSFEIGFLITLPFLVIDVIVSSVVMSMGMMMLSPQVFSLPLKILFFVMIDGWGLLVRSLMRSVS